MQMTVGELKRKVRAKGPWAGSLITAKASEFSIIHEVIDDKEPGPQELGFCTFMAWVWWEGQLAAAGRYVSEEELAERIFRAYAEVSQPYMAIFKDDITEEWEQLRRNYETRKEKGA